MPPSHPPLVIAHRGASAYAPENTLAAFRRAMELAADMSELDLHLSRDGRLVVMHNATVEATTGGHGALADLTLAEIKRLDAGQGERVPVLDEVLDLVAAAHGLYIELKAPGTPAALAELLRGRPATGWRQPWPQFVAGSFRPELVREARELLPAGAGGVPVALLVGPVYPAEVLIAMCRAARADIIHLCWGSRHPRPHTLVTPDLLAALRGAGLGIVLWNEERPEEIAALRRMDVDAICTNTPDRFRP